MAGFSCSKFAFIHAETSSVQTDTCSCRPYKTASVRRLTVTVNLGVVCIRMRREMMTINELQQVGSVKEKQDRYNDRALWHSKKNCRWHRTGCRRANLLLSVAESLRYDVNQSMTFPPRPYDFLNRCRSVLSIDCNREVKACEVNIMSRSNTSY